MVTISLSILSSCNKSVKMRLVAICHLQICYNLLKRLAASLWITHFDNQLTTSLLTTCNRLVVNKLSQAMRTHPDIGLLVTSCCKMSTDLLTSWVWDDNITVYLFSFAYNYTNNKHAHNYFCSNPKRKRREKNLISSFVA